MTVCQSIYFRMDYKLNPMSLANKISKIFSKSDQNAAPKGVNIHSYIGKFVKQNGSDIGESIAVEKGRIIVKRSDVIMSIPLEKIVTNTENIVVGNFNREESLRLGKEWFARRNTLKFDKKGELLGAPKH